MFFKYLKNLLIAVGISILLPVLGVAQALAVLIAAIQGIPVSTSVDRIEHFINNL